MSFLNTLNHSYIKFICVASLVVAIFTVNSSNNHLDGIDNSDMIAENEVFKLKGHFFKTGFIEEEGSEFEELPERTRFSAAELNRRRKMP